MTTNQTDKTILLLHGLGVYGESWGYQTLALTAAGYHVMAPDLPGFGSSPAVSRRWSVAAAAREMIRLLDEAGIGRTVVCGLSMGGTVALQLALDYPQRIAGLVLINTFSALRPASLSESVYFIRRGLRAYMLNPGEQAQLVADRIFPYPEQADWRQRLIASIRNADPEVYRQAMLSLARFNVNSRLAGLLTPSMVITGMEDSTIPPSVQRRMAALIPGCDLHEIAGGGHGVIVDHPDAVNYLLLNFMGKIYSN